MNATTSVAENRTGVSRIGWGAVFAGAFVAFAAITVLNTLGVAIGMSGDPALGWPTATWAVIVSLVSLFLGGWVLSRSEAISNRGEAALHGVVLWGMLFFGMTILAVAGIRVGLSAVMGAVSAVAQQYSLSEVGQIAQNLGLSKQQVAQLQQRLGEGGFPAASSAWWSFISMIVSLAAVVLGSLTGVPQARVKESRRAPRGAEPAT